MKWIRVGGFGLGLDGSGRGGWAYVSTALPLGSRQRVSLYGKRQKTAGGGGGGEAWVQHTCSGCHGRSEKTNRI